MVIANCRKPSRKQDRKKKIAWQDQFEGAFHLTDIEVVEARFAWKVGQIILTNDVKFISIVAKLYFNIKKAIFAKHFNFNAIVACLLTKEFSWINSFKSCPKGLPYFFFDEKIDTLLP